MLTVIKDVELKLAKDPARGNVQSFLESLLVEVTASNYRYFLSEHLAISRGKLTEPHTHCWPPLLANERQISGLFSVGLSAICPVSRPEHAIRRPGEGRSDEDSPRDQKAGRVDFHAYYGARDIALELKCCHISSIGDASNNQTLKNKWKSVYKQSKDALLDMRKRPQSHTHPVSIGLLVVLVGRKVTSRKGTEQVQQKSGEAMTNIANGVKKATKADFLAYYVPPAEIQVISGWGDTEDESKVFPGVIFAAVVHGSTKEAQAK